MGKFRYSSKASRAVHKAKNIGHCKTRVNMGKHAKVTIGTKGIHTSIKMGPVTYKPSSGRYSVDTPIKNVKYYGRTKCNGTSHSSHTNTEYHTDNIVFKNILRKSWFIIIAIPLLLMIMTMFTGCEENETTTVDTVEQIIEYQNIQYTSNNSSMNIDYYICDNVLFVRNNTNNAIKVKIAYDNHNRLTGYSEEKSFCLSTMDYIEPNQTAKLVIDKDSIFTHYAAGGRVKSPYYNSGEMCDDDYIQYTFMRNDTLYMEEYDVNYISIEEEHTERKICIDTVNEDNSINHIHDSNSNDIILIKE